MNEVLHITKKKILQIILLVLAIFIPLTIFSFSSQNGEASQGLSRKISGKIVEITSIGQDLNEYELAERINKVDRVIRKIAHFSLYTILGITIMSFFCTIKMEDKKRVIITTIIGMLYAISDEIHQIFVPDRSPHVTDVMLDTLGVIFGVLIVLLVIKVYQERIKKQKNYPSLIDIFFDNFSEVPIDGIERAIDTFIDNEALNAMPIAASINAIIKTGKDIHKANLLKQTEEFIKSLKNQTISQEKLQQYKKELYENEKKAKEELGRVILILDNIKDIEKSRLLAKFYATFVNQEINWSKFCEFADVIEKIFVTDIETAYELYKSTEEKEVSVKQYDRYKADRLVSTGILSLYSKPLTVREISGNGSRDTFEKNGFGELFVKIAKKDEKLLGK